MPNTTLYVKEADLPLLEKAKTKLGDSLSSIFVDCLRQRMDHQPPARGKTAKITLETRRSQGALTIRKTFEGRWLIDANDDLRAEQEENSAIRWDSHVTYELAQTKKGALVVYVCDPEDNDGTATMEIYGDFEELKSAEADGCPLYPENVIAAFADALGQPYAINLDI